MGIVNKITKVATLGLVDDITGEDAAKDAAKEAARVQAAAGGDAIAAQQLASAKGQEFLQPFAELGQQGIDQAGFLANPQAQFEFLQSNPLFQMGLDNLNTQTQNVAASRGRLSAGDTLQQLTNNSLLAAQPLIGQQRQDINNLLNLGSGIAQTQANVAIGEGTNVGNLLTDIGAATAGGIVGASNIEAQGRQGLLQAGLTGAGLAFSDPRLKTNIKKIGQRNGFDWFSWDWNDIAVTLGLKGSSEGVMADRVQLTNPELIGENSGYMTVNYGGIL